MSKHTPGPWKAVPQSTTEIAIVAPWSEEITPGNAPGFADYQGIYVCALQHHRGDGAAPKDHAEANARLIAAAPELLDALQALVFQVSESMGWGCPKARIVIAKATGEAA